jgi:hypothetical protein
MLAMKRVLTLGALLGCVLERPYEAAAQSGGSYNLSWNTFDGGGATFSTGAAYRLGGAVGQPDAGAHTGGLYALSGGFFYAGIAATSVGEPPVPPGEPVPPGSRATPLAFHLYPGAPNPFTEKTTIAFELPERAGVEARVFNLSGELVRTLVRTQRAAGRHEITWDGSDNAGRGVAHGIYFLQLKAGVHAGTQKMILTR